MGDRNELQVTRDALVRPGKGILAADESGPTIAKRFKAIGVESTEENRRAYRELILGAPGLGEFISGVILYEETLAQRTTDGTPLPQLAARQGIVPGIKVDAGKIPLALAPGDEITQGLDGLAKRLDGYKEQGARFAKWRAVYNVSDTLPSRLAVEANAQALARYAAICQEQGVVPIVEPEVLIDGDHSLARCAEVTEAVLHEVFHARREATREPNDHRCGIGRHIDVLAQNAHCEEVVPSGPEAMAPPHSTVVVAAGRQDATPGARAIVVEPCSRPRSSGACWLS